ncbi:MAG: carbohydrate kinase family protein [archaeon]
MFDIVSVGSAAQDIFVDTELKEIIKKKKHFIGYLAGSKILVKDINFFTGGGGTNTAVSFSRLGLKTGYIGNLTDDLSSWHILEELKREGVTFLGNIEKGMKGSISVVLDSHEHNRTILVYKGVNDELDPSEVKFNFNTKWIYLSSMLRKSFQTQKKLAKKAYSKGIKIAYNPSEYQVTNGIGSIRDLIKITEILVLNKEEAKLLLGLKRDCNIAVKDLTLSISKFGPRIVCITDEDKGAYCLNTHERKFCYLNTHDIKVIERTGAGDSFASAFVGAIIRGEDTETSLQIAGANAESVITYLGAKNILLTWNQAIQSIKKRPFKIKLESI